MLDDLVAAFTCQACAPVAILSTDVEAGVQYDSFRLQVVHSGKYI
jgi:hypothetical protein